jgi:uncharacterized protein (TIGR04255 family)
MIIPMTGSPLVGSVIVRFRFVRYNGDPLSPPPMPQLPAQKPYPSAPVRFVAFEVQFGLAPSLSTQDGRAAVYERLRDAYPIADAQTTLRVAIGPQGAMPSPAGADLVMTNREHTRSVTIGANALTVQTTVFSSSEDLVAAIAEALRAVEPAGITTTRRIGLRFVNEIRAPGVERADQWTPLINDDLLGPARYAGDYIVDGSETTLGLQIEDEIRAVVRFGPNTGFAVDPNGRLRLPSSEQGHFFLLDIDIFWQPTDDAFLSFAAENIIDTYRRLDEPSHRLFERAITDRARDLFQTEHS